MIESGRLGGSEYQFEFLVPGMWAGVVVELGRAEAIQMIWWHRPELEGMSPEDVMELRDDDGFLDVLKDAVRAWVETFPLASTE